MESMSFKQHNLVDELKEKLIAFETGVFYFACVQSFIQKLFLSGVMVGIVHSFCLDPSWPGDLVFDPLFNSSLCAPGYILFYLFFLCFKKFFHNRDL